MIFFDVKADSKSETITQVEPTSKENGQQFDSVEKANMNSLIELLRSLKQRERSKDEIYTGEWQTVAKILDRLLFNLNILSMIIAFVMDTQNYIPIKVKIQRKTMKFHSIFNILEGTTQGSISVINKEYTKSQSIG